MWHALCMFEGSQVFDFYELIIQKGCLSASVGVHGSVFLRWELLYRYAWPCVPEVCAPAQVCMAMCSRGVHACTGVHGHVFPRCDFLHRCAWPCVPEV